MGVIRCESDQKLITPNSQAKTQNSPPPNSIAHLQFKTPMLLCPRCQFENPNPNKFCQQCGNSLIYKPCHECGAQVAFSAKECQNCGVATGSSVAGHYLRSIEFSSSRATRVNHTPSRVSPKTRDGSRNRIAPKLC